MTLPHGTADGAGLHVLSTLATKGAWPALMALIEPRLDIRIDTFFGPTNALLQRIKSQEAVDAVVLTKEAAADLANAGVLLSPVDLAKSYVGLAVPAGAPKPDIHTVEALRTALVAARSVAYSQVGASGVFFAKLIRRLGIADAVNARAIIVNGVTGEKLVTGEADVAIQQVSELKLVRGIDVVGPLPLELQAPVAFSAAVMATSKNLSTAAQFVQFLASREALQPMIASGLEPI